MPNVYIRDIGVYEGQEVTLRGWLWNRRGSGKIHFLIVRDGTGFIQAVAPKGEVSDEVFETAARLTQESSLLVTGKVRAEERAPNGYELSVTGVEIVQLAQDYPITKKEHGTDFLMDHRHLWLRSPRQHAILRVRNEVIKAARDYLDDHGFTLLDSPILTPSAAEGTSNLFQTDYFGEPAYLAQTGQLYAEAGAMAFGKVYTFGPTFRAEKSKTRRHLTEFWMIEPEVAYAELEDNLLLQEQFVSYIVQRCLERCAAELKLLERDITHLEKIQAPFPRITYDEAGEILRKNGVDFTWGDDFGGTDETILADAFDRPVFVTHYPAECKAFYMQPDPDRPEVVLCADLLAPEGYGEIIGGSQRIHDYDLLLQRIEQYHLPREAYEWYLDLRRYGSVPHAGFGIGVERTVAWICGLEHIRETSPFPRMISRLYP